VGVERAHHTADLPSEKSQIFLQMGLDRFLLICLTRLGKNGVFSAGWCTILRMTNRPFKTGESRDQASLLPARIEDYVGPDNPVRAIESFVCALDLAKLGFCHADRSSERAGQPPYDPADLLKLYLYGYINQVRSSRRLEREACRNLELIWLLKNLQPGYRTIANFRKENWKSLKAVNRSFVLLARELDLVGGTVVAVDGSFFHGDASKASIFTRKRLAGQIAKLDQEIEACGKSLEDNDASEAKEPGKNESGDGGGDGGDLGARVAQLMARRSRAQADLDRLEGNGETQLSLTDPDARLLSKGDQTIAGYNVQSVVDDKHKLIVASEVVNSSDAGHLHAMAKAAADVLEAKSLQVLADAGYYSSADLKACEDDGIVAYVPPSEGNGMLEKQGRFSLKDFSYDPVVDAYHCPAGELLRPMEGRWQNLSGRLEIRYVSRRAVCDACQSRARCLTPKAPYRTIRRWEHEDVLERHRARMQNARELMRRRSAIVEHPFGTLKCRAGYRHFLVRGFNKVRGEWNLMALCYNFTRVLNILGFDGFIACIAKLLARLQYALAAALQRMLFVLETFWTQIASWSAINPTSPTPAR
jgi:transposase